MKGGIIQVNVGNPFQIIHPKRPAGGSIDPVCGMTVDPANAAGKFEYKDTTYYFCATCCLNKFQADPERYTGEKPAPPAEPVQAGVEYTCPMHPEVRQIGPGVCPKCGMALEPATFSRGRAAQSRTRGHDEAVPGRAAAHGSDPPLDVVYEMSTGRHFARCPGCEFALATPVVLWAGWPFFERGLGFDRQPQPEHVHPDRAWAPARHIGYSVVATLAPGLFPDSFRGTTARSPSTSSRPPSS